MLTEQFVALFGAGDDAPVRALFAWDLLARQESRVDERVVLDAAELGAYWTVWHVGADRRPLDFDAPGARPLTVAEAAALADRWPAARQAAVDALTARMAADAGTGRPVQLLLPTLALPDGGSLLLDGTHRVLAAARVGAPVRVLELRLVTALSEDLLPDLRHHLRRAPRSVPRPSTLTT